MDKRGQLSPKTVAGIVLIGIGIYLFATPSLPYYSIVGVIVLVAGFFLVASG